MDWSDQQQIPGKGPGDAGIHNPVVMQKSEYTWRENTVTLNFYRLN